MDLTIARAVEADAAAITRIHLDCAADLTERFGRGHWSYLTTEGTVLRGIRTEHVLVARDGGSVVGTLQLQTRKPWAIDRSYFTEVPRPLYLVSMGVRPEVQRLGVGARLLDAAIETASAWPAQSIRLDAYDAEAGAGAFYARCGFSEVGRATYRGAALIYYERLITG